MTAALKQALEALKMAVSDRYEYRDGGLWVKANFNSRAAVGSRAGSYLRDGYRTIKVNGRSYREHHLVWLVHKGRMPELEIDHINCIRDDNRIENLRECTRHQNMQNRRFPMAGNELGFLGVTRHGRKFRAAITLAGKKKYLGLFHKPEEAHAAYVEAQRAHNIPAAQEGK